MTDAEREPRHVVSWGGGVQSTTILRMAQHGEIAPMPDCAIFADTGDEPRAVYDHIAQVRADDSLPFPVYVARQPFSLGANMEALGQCGEDIVIGLGGTVPFFTVNPDGSHGMLNRHCTANYKVGVLIRAAQKLFGRDVPITHWIGISTDEASRMKPSRHRQFTNRFPLAMEHRMSRQDCLAWMERHGYSRPPRSACVFCPYHSDNEWRHLRDHHPTDWRRAVEFERKITHGLRGTRGERFFLHAQRVPLDDVDLDTPKDRGQLELGYWGEECEGMCGV